MSKAIITFPAGGTPYALDVEDEGIFILSNPDAINFKGAGVTVVENPTGEAEVTITGVQFWTESESAATQQNTRWIPNNAAANVSAVVQPKGNGANLAQRPDGTATGGGARGNFATDWQKQRNNTGEIASGSHSTISGGRNNTASGNDSTVSGGRNNTASGNDSTCIGGFSANAGGVQSIVGGDQVSASGLADICIGSESLASGGRAVAIGREARATGPNSSAETGGNLASGLRSRATGGGAYARNAHQRAWGASYVASGSTNISSFSGRAQEGCIIGGYNSRLTSPSPQLQSTGSLFYLNPGNGVNSGNTSLWIPATTNQQFTFQLKLQATVTAITGTATGINVGDVKQWSIDGCGKIVAGVLTILNSGTTPVILYEDAGLATMAASFIVGTSNSVGVQITNATFAGGGSLEVMVNGYLYYQETALN